MRKLATAAAVSLSLVTVPGSIQAVSLGDIEMYSTLNQPLEAEVGILSVERSELQDLVIKGAPVGSLDGDASATDALAPPPSLSNLRFKLVQRPDGSAAIRITSDAPVIEPFLNFMLSVDTVGGERMVREYTVLLDPPVFGLAQTDYADELLPAGNAEATDGSAVIQRKPKATSRKPQVTVPSQGVVVDFSSELVPQAADQLPAYLSEADRVAVSMSDVTGEHRPSVTDRDYDSIETSTAVVAQMTESQQAPTRAPTQAPNLADAGLHHGVEIALLPEMFESEQPYEEIDLSALAIARDDSWYKGSKVLDLIEPIARDDSWYASAVDVELTPTMFGLNVPPATDSMPATLPRKTQLAMQTEFDYAKDGIPVSLDELAVSLGRRVIGNVDSEVMMIEESRVTLKRSEIPAAATFEPGPDATTVAASTPQDEFDINGTDADGGEPTGERIDIEKELPAFEARKKELQQLASEPKTYRVKGSDTLWSIADKRRGKGVTTQQMMVALLRANGDAFVDQDMNRLRNGAILRIPEQSSAVSVSQAEALGLVREQMNLWQKYRGTTAVTSVSRPLQTQAEPAVAEPESTAPVAPEAEPETSLETSQEQRAETEQPVAPDLQDRLTIVGVEGSAQDAENAGLADGNAQASTAQSAAAQLAEEQAIADRLEAEEKLARDQELAAIEAGKQRLITLQEEQLAALQEQVSTDTTATQTAQSATATDPNAEDATQTLASQTELDDVPQAVEQALPEALKQELDALAAASDATENSLVAEAQSRAERLAGEADAIEAQLVALQSEKRALEDIGDLDKAALVAEAEQEKSRLLAGAQSEQERIAAELEVQRQAIKDDLERKQLELKANPDLQLGAQDSEAAVSESIDPTGSADGDTEPDEIANIDSQGTQPYDMPTEAVDAATTVDGDNNADVANAIDGDKDSDAVGTIRLVDADTDESAQQANLQTSTVDTNLDTSTAAPSGLATTLQKALGDRNTLLGTGAGLALLGLLGAWLLRRKPKPRVTAAREEPDFALVDPHPQTEVADKQVRAVGNLDNKPGVSSMPATQGAMTAEAMDETLVQDDTVSEADVYLAYGLYGQAEEMLTAAIDRSPDDADYQMKLIETHFVQRDREKFQAAAARFQDSFDDADARNRIDQMSSDLDSEAAVQQDDTPSGVIDALAANSKSAAVDVPPVVQNALDVEANADNQKALPEPDIKQNTASEDDLHGLEALLGDQAGPNDGQVAKVAADEAAPVESALDQTIDPGAEFKLSELEATGEFGSIDADAVSAAKTEASVDIADATLDEVDLSALDDDGTLNLDGVAGDTMSDLDLENMDLTQQGLDSTLDNLTLDDADLDLASGFADTTETQSAAAGEGSDMGTMLDLAKAYLDMGDNDSALSALREIAEGGTPSQREEAQALLKNLG